LGAHFFRELEPTQQRRTLDRGHIRLHHLWTPSLIQNDIAMLELPTAVTQNNHGTFKKNKVMFQMKN